MNISTQIQECIKDITGKSNGPRLIFHVPPDAPQRVENPGKNRLFQFIGEAFKRVFDSFISPFLLELVLGPRLLEVTYRLLKDDPYSQRGARSRLTA